MQEVFCAVSSTFLYPEAIRSALTYPLDSDLSVGKRYPPFIQLGPNVQKIKYGSVTNILVTLSEVMIVDYFGYVPHPFDLDFPQAFKLV